MSVEFRDDPNQSSSELQQEVRRVVAQLNDGALVATISGKYLNAGENAVSHGGTSRPQAFYVTPHSTTMHPIARSRDSDERCVYVDVAAAGFADILLHF